MLSCLIKLFALGLLAGAISIGLTDKKNGVGGAVCMGIFALLLLALPGKRGKDSWRSDAATARQKSFADELGIKYTKRTTKGELSDLISERTGR